MHLSHVVPRLLQDMTDLDVEGAVYLSHISPHLLQDMTDLERRCHAAELRHQELTAKLPETARPLLRQIEAMQVPYGRGSRPISQALKL